MAALPPLPGRIVGFDLDMTLVDTSTATAAALSAVNRQLGTVIDVDACVRRMSAAPRAELARWVPAELMDDAMRTLATSFLGAPLSLVRELPGAGAQLARLRAEGIRTVVVTTRRPRIADACLRRCGLAVDRIAGGMRDGKADALRDLAVDCYVGDHPQDMAAARAAGVPGIGVTTGFHDAAALTGAGATTVVAGLADL